MNTGDLIKEMSDRSRLQLEFTQEMVGLFLDVLVESLENGNDIIVKGLGTFRWKTAPPKKIRHPRTGDIINAPERMLLKFNPARALRRRPCVKTE